MAEEPKQETQSETITDSNSVDWDVHGLYDGFRNTWAVDNARSRDVIGNTNALTDLQITGSPTERSQKVNDTANEIIQSNILEHHAFSAINPPERTALDMQRFIRQQLHQGMNPEDLGKSLQNLQNGWQVKFDGDKQTFTVTGPNDNRAVSSMVRVRDVAKAGEKESPQQAAARLAERLDVLKDNPEMMRAYMQGVNQFLARAQLSPTGQAYTDVFASAFKSRMPAGSQFEATKGPDGKYNGTRLTQSGNEIFNGTFPEANTLKDQVEQFRVAQTTLAPDLPPGTGQKVLEAYQNDPRVKDRISQILGNPDIPFKEQIRKLHGLDASATDQQLASEIEKTIKSNVRQELIEMRNYVNDYALKNGGTSLADNATADDIRKAVEKIRGPFKTQPADIQQFDPKRDAFLYSFPRSAGAPILSDGRTNPQSYVCHNFTFDKYDAAPSVIDELERGNYQPIERRADIREGDIVLYRDKNWDGDHRTLSDPGHSGRVVKVNPDGSILIASKNNYGSLIIHHPLDPSLMHVYGPHVNFYRKTN